MANSKRLTDLMIERLRPPATGRLTVWDQSEAGLGIRIGASRRTFILKLRHYGRQRMATLGHFPGMGVADARTTARKLKQQSLRGIAPDEAYKPGAGSDKRRLETISDLVEAYIENYAKPNQRSWKDTAGHLRNNLCRLHGSRPIASINRSDIHHMLDDVRGRGVVQGTNRLLAHSKRFFGWCVERGTIDTSPASDIRAPFKEQSRDRVLTDTEIRRIWHAAEALAFPIGSAVQMLLLTGQRRDEVSQMRWDEIDYGARLWTIPAERNKSGRPHQIPLSDLANIVLQTAPQGRAFVFWGRSPDRAINGWSKAKQRLDELSGVTNWRIHDLRRTAATGMARLGFDPHVVERVLNHATTGSGPLARVYQRYAYEDEKRQALEAWADHVARLDALT